MTLEHNDASFTANNAVLLSKRDEMKCDVMTANDRRKNTGAEGKHNVKLSEMIVQCPIE